MANDAAQTPQQPQQQQAPLTVNAQYIKDLSFEIPGAPAIFGELAQAAPELNVQVGIDTQHLGETVYEAALRMTVEAKIKDKVAFICDLTYAGIFTLVLPQEHVQPVLMVECPRLLFPFCRSIIADATREGGFPPVLLQPLDFLELYRQRMQAAANEQPADGTAKA